MDNVVDLLTAESLRLLQSVAQTGSMAAAARQLGLVPSALTYRVRQLEESLDVLLFDRSNRKATLTPAGKALLAESQRILDDLDSVAQRVKRIASGWESQLTIAVSGLVSMTTMLELCGQFFASGAPTQLKLRTENLSGTWQALETGLADLAIGNDYSAPLGSSIVRKPLGDVPFVFAVAPHHALARAAEPLSAKTIAAHQSVAVADSARRGPTVSVGIEPGQRVFTVTDMQNKLQAQILGLGCGYLPNSIACSYISRGQLIVKKTVGSPRVSRLAYGWRAPETPAKTGQALAWWLAQLQNTRTRSALLRHGD
jgi:DNA-binding transcriptional LysR family regulator